MSLTDAFAHVATLVGNAAIVWRRMQGRVGEQAVGTAPKIPEARPQGRIPTLKMPTAQGWVAGPASDRSARVARQRLRHRPEAPALDPRVAQRRRHGGRSAVHAGRREVGVRPRDDRHHAARRRHRPEPEPHHPASRRRRRRRGRSPRALPRRLEPAVRHGAGRRHVLRRQHRRHRRLPVHGRHDADRRAGRAG